MDPLQQFNWVASPLHIKEEVPEPVPTLLSPPTTPSSFTFSSSPSLPPSRVLSPPTSGRIRPRPYPSTKPPLKKDSESLSPSYLGMWNTTSGMRGTSRSVSAAGHRTSDEERQAVYNSTMVNDAFMMSTNPGSSLLGAMGTTSTAQYGRAPPLYPSDTIGWNPDIAIMSTNSDTPYPTGIPSHSNVFSSIPTQGYGNLHALRNGSPESIGPRSPSYQPASSGHMVPPYCAPQSPSSGSQSPSYPQGYSDTEVRHLRQRVMELEHALSETRSVTQSSTSASALGSTTPPAGWRRRTEARTKKFCSLNRAGNALCAWHDSRRERRQYPPRNAPQGMLNCGCTHEEALFEESLSRHGVGGYLPGESVRMDPELRRPLLRLLQKRYGYKDGDFDYDPHTGQWYHEQDPETWTRQAHSGSSARARRPEHMERH